MIWKLIQGVQKKVPDIIAKQIMLAIIVFYYQLEARQIIIFSIFVRAQWKNDDLTRL